MSVKITLISSGEIRNKLNQILPSATVIRGSIAFWTFGINKFKANSDDPSNKQFFLDKGFLKALKNKTSFICVDISTETTKLDAINECVQEADNFYLFKYRWNKKKKNLDRDYNILTCCAIEVC
jgi:hypothetical protein